VLESFVLVTARGEEEVCVHLLALRSSSAGEQSSLISVRLTAADALGREGAAAAELQPSYSGATGQSGRQRGGEGSGRRPELGGAPASRSVRRRRRSSPAQGVDGVSDTVRVDGI